jgi:hypothetical protein
MTASTLATALAVAGRGYAVFPANWPIKHRGRTICSCCCELRGMPPCEKPAKHPRGLLVPHGLLDASKETWQIKLWWQRAPEANLGIECTGLIVVDIDPDDGGDESFEKLEAEHGEMPLTWRTLTGGGEHIFFTCPDGVEVSNVVAKTEIKFGREPPLGPGIDIRTKGGYVIAPPSRHISGRSYAWSVDHHPANVPLAPSPDWLVERLTAHTTKSGKGHDPAHWAAWAGATHSEYRDAAVTRMAGKLLRAVSLDPDYVLILLLDWNARHCDPPLPEHEVQDIFDRICKREIKRWEAKNA